MGVVEVRLVRQFQAVGFDRGPFLREESANNVSDHPLGRYLICWKSNGDALEGSHVILDVRDNLATVASTSDTRYFQIFAIRGKRN